MNVDLRPNHINIFVHYVIAFSILHKPTIIGYTHTKLVSKLPLSQQLGTRAIGSLFGLRGYFNFVLSSLFKKLNVPIAIRSIWLCKVFKEDDKNFVHNKI